jgi:hypothetical protein
MKECFHGSLFIFFEKYSGEKSVIIVTPSMKTKLKSTFFCPLSTYLSILDNNIFDAIRESNLFNKNSLRKMNISFIFNLIEEK